MKKTDYRSATYMRDNIKEKEKKEKKCYITTVYTHSFIFDSQSEWHNILVPRILIILFCRCYCRTIMPLCHTHGAILHHYYRTFDHIYTRARTLVFLCERSRTSDDVSEADALALWLSRGIGLSTTKRTSERLHNVTWRDFLSPTTSVREHFLFDFLFFTPIELTLRGRAYLLAFCSFFFIPSFFPSLSLSPLFS